MISRNLTLIVRTAFCLCAICCAVTAQDANQGYVPDKKVQETALSVIQATPIGGDPAVKSPGWMEWRVISKDRSEASTLIYAHKDKVFVFYARTPIPEGGELFVLRPKQQQFYVKARNREERNGIFAIVKSPAEVRLVPFVGSTDAEAVLELIPADGRISPFVVIMRGPEGSGCFVSVGIRWFDPEMRKVYADGCGGDPIGGTESTHYDYESRRLSVTVGWQKEPIVVEIPINALRYSAIKWNEESRPIATPEDLAMWGPDMPEWMMQPLRWPTREEIAGKASKRKDDNATAGLPVFHEQKRDLVPLDLRQHTINVEDWEHFEGWGDSAKHSRTSALIVRYEGRGTVIQLFSAKNKRILMLRDYDGLFGIPKEATLLKKLAFVAEKCLGDVRVYPTDPDPSARYKVQQEGKDGKWISGTLHRGPLNPGPHDFQGQDVRFITNGVFYLFDLR